MYIQEKNNTSPLCILCMLMPQIIPPLTLTLVCTWYEESYPPWEDFNLEILINLKGEGELPTTQNRYLVCLTI